MKLTVHEFLTLDGVLQSPGAPGEDVSGGFTGGGWIVPLFDHDTGAIVASWFTHTTAVLLGRTTWDIMRPYWSQIPDSDMHRLPKHVVTSSPLTPQWNASTAVNGDLVAEVTRLKGQPGDELQVHGSGRLAASLHAAGLVDEYRLIVFPVTVGQGKRLFTGDAPMTGFTLVETRRTASGAVYSVLARSDASIGTFSVVEGKESARIQP